MSSCQTTAFSFYKPVTDSLLGLPQYFKGLHLPFQESISILGSLPHCSLAPLPAVSSWGSDNCLARRLQPICPTSISSALHLFFSTCFLCSSFFPLTSFFPRQSHGTHCEPRLLLSLATTQSTT